MTKYVLKANTISEGVIYYMNVICFTGDIEAAEEYDTIEAANKDKPYFENQLRNMSQTCDVRIVDKAGEIIDSTDKDVIKRWPMNQ